MDYSQEKLKESPAVEATVRDSSDDRSLTIDKEMLFSTKDDVANYELQKMNESSLAIQKYIKEVGGVSRVGQLQHLAYEPQPDVGDIMFHNLAWWQVGLLMIAETISLGILSLPSVLAVVGFPAGVLLILGIGILGTYTGYNIGLFKMVYPHVENMGDAGRVLAGRPGELILGSAQAIFIIFICGSHVLTGLIAFKTMTQSNICGILWSVLTTVVCFVLCLPRTFHKLSYYSFASFVSILAAVFLTMIAVGVRGQVGEVSATTNVTFTQGFLACTNIIFAYAGHVAFFNFIAEMKKPKDYPKALYMLQAADTSLYLIAATVIYYYVGSGAKSPALGNTGLLVRRIAYGLAMPTIIISGVINGSVGVKLIMRYLLVNDGVASKHYTHSTTKGWIIWVSIVGFVWVTAFIIAEVIPFFNDLLGIIASLFASIFTFSISGVFWLYINPRKTWFASPRRAMICVLNMLIVAAGIMIMVCGVWSSIQSIIDGYATREFKKPFRCSGGDE